MQYPTSLSDESWNFIKAIFESFGESDKGRVHKVKSIVYAIFYVADNGTPSGAIFLMIFHHGKICNTNLACGVIRQGE
jgi:hypothetical protein